MDAELNSTGHRVIRTGIDSRLVFRVEDTAQRASYSAILGPEEFQVRGDWGLQRIPGVGSWNAPNGFVSDSVRYILRLVQANVLREELIRCERFIR